MSSRILPPGRHHVLATAVSRALLLGSLSLPAVLPAVAHAETASTAAQQYTIAPGSLDSALNRYADQAGILLAIDAQLTSGKTSAGLNGSFSVQEGLARILAGTGLEAVAQADGNFVLRKVSVQQSSDAAELGAINVVAQATAVTEGSGSYTTRSTNTATRLALSPRETPQSVTVMTRQAIEDKGLTDMEAVLNYTPGVTMVGDASENSQIFVRGFYLDSGIQVDGLITTPASAVYEGSISQGLDPVIADRVEVVKGAAGIVSGLGEPSATVNFVRKRPTADTQAYVQVGAGSWNTLRTEGDISGALTEDKSVRGRLVGSWQDNESFMDRYTTSKYVAYGVVEADLSDKLLASIAVDSQRSRTGGAYNWSSNPAFYTDGTLFTPDHSFSTGQDWSYWDVDQYSVTPQLEYNINDDWTAKASYRFARATIDRVSFYAGEYVDKASGNIIPYSGNPPTADYDDRDSETQSFDIYTTGAFSLLNRKHELVFGYNYAQNDFYMATYKSGSMPFYNINDGAIPAPAISSTMAYGSEDKQTQSGVYSTVRINIADPLKLMLGVRVSNWEFESSDLSGGPTTTMEHKNTVTPYYGIIYDINSVASTYASYTSIFRPTTNYGADGKVLDPAEGSNIEAGFKLSFFDDRLNASIAGYETSLDNFAEYANAGQLPNGKNIYKSVDGVKTTGGEFEVSGQLNENWQLMAGYAHNRSKDASGNPKQTYIPTDTFKISSTYNLNGALRNLTVGGSIRWQNDSYYDVTIFSTDGLYTTVANTRQEQPTYTLLDLMARYKFTPKLAATLNLNNVFDKEYNRSMWGYADYGDPRNFMLSLKWSL